MEKKRKKKIPTNDQELAPQNELKCPVDPLHVACYRPTRKIRSVTGPHIFGYRRKKKCGIHG